MNGLGENIHREITPLQKNDCFLVFDRHRKVFNFPIHFHPEFELNYIANAGGARRLVGDHIAQIGNKELVLTGPNLYHGWQNYENSKTNDFHEITIQFPNDVFNLSLLDKNLLKPIKLLFQNANRGILFSKETTVLVEKQILSLSKTNGFDSFLKFQSLLYDLAISRGQTFLTNMSFQHQNDFYNSERIEKVYHFLKENYHRKIKIEEVAALLNMSVISLSRLIKQRTGKSFIEFLIEVRLGSATRRLIESNESITEICFDCGFNNISNFNRIFKKYQNCTPSEFRTSFSGVKSVY
jgi:AraC-like DNA-binding protein